jgi:hypothetical protein
VDKIYICDAALYDFNGELTFDASGTPGSCITANGNSTVKALRLDDYVFEFPPTFIKLDIEGSEMNALVGAKNTILKHKPKLAVCVYHKPTDLWEIPLFLKKLVPEYTIHLRHHSDFLNETVCYAAV